jgi:hypothetical protein
MLEVEVGGVDGGAHQLGKHTVEVAGGKATGGEQAAFGEG